MKLVPTVLSALALLIGSGYAIPQSGTSTTSTRPPPTITVGPIRPTESCICPGPLLCCSSIVDSESPDGEKVLDQLGVDISGTHIPVGVQCFPYSPFLPVVCTNPVCCFDANNPSVGAVGCVRVPTFSPGPNPTTLPAA